MLKLTYVVTMPADDKYNDLDETLAMPYGMKGFLAWDLIRYDDNVVDITDKVSSRVRASWIAASMWGWDTRIAEDAIKYVAGLKVSDFIMD